MTALTEVQAKHIRELLRSARARREGGEFVIEGPHLLEVALEKAQQQIKLVAFTAEAARQYAPLAVRCRDSRSIPEKLANRISDTEQSQGIFAVLKIPESTKASGDIVLALDAIQDPGNVGTIVRTAAWFGVKSILLGEGCADAFAPKVVRATQGAIFSVNLEEKVDLKRRLLSLQSEGYKIAATTLDAKAKSLYDINVSQRSILLLGSEAHGISQELLSIADTSIVIPRFGEGESLNVATSAAIILSEFCRRSKR
jgi:TrmH family RNA methyltransferase